MLLPTGPDQRSRVEEFQRRHRVALLTLLFTDIVGSTQIKQQLGDTQAVMLIQQHHAALRALLAQFPEGEEIETAGDSFFLIFTKPSDAVRFALLWQHRVRDLARQTGRPLLDRIGIHVGEVFVQEHGAMHKPKDLYGLQVDTCARVMGLGQGDQILLTRTAFDSARQILKCEELAGLGPLEWLNHGPYAMKGVEDPVEVCEAGESGVAVLKAPGDTEKARRQVAAGSEPVLGWRPGAGITVPNTQWRLEEKLGEGGVGEVWLARHATLKERRVFKFCFRADLVRTLKREVTLFKVLKERVGANPHMVALHDVFFEEPPYYLVTDFAAGRDLVAWCARHGGVDKVPVEVRLEIVAQIADALQAAQDAGIVHRDVKPSNILLADAALPKDPAAVRALLGDFGIGQLLNPELASGVTRVGLTLTAQGTTGSASGTLAYMAPEVVAGKPADARSDLYSLGVVLFQLLTGDLIRPVTTDWQESIGDPLLAADLRRCFAGDPQQRFHGAGELAHQLRALPERRARLAAEEAAQRERERAAQRRGMMRVGALAGALVVVFATLAGWAWRQTRFARQESSGRLKEWQRAEMESTNRLAQWQRAEAGEEQSRRLLYAADMNLAQQALKLNNLGKARRLLDRHRPEFGVPASAGPGLDPSRWSTNRLKAGLQTNLRGWEWRYLWQLTRSSALATLTNRPTTRGWSVSFSPDGTRLAAGWDNGHVDLWDVPGGGDGSGP